jgi:transketolase
MEEILKSSGRSQIFDRKRSTDLYSSENGNGLRCRLYDGNSRVARKAPNDEQLAKALDQLEETLGDY